MIAEAMIDTNVLVYAASALEADRDESRAAQSLLQQEQAGLSAQVLQEFPWVTTRKVCRARSLDDVFDGIEALEDFPCVPVDASLVRFGGEFAIGFQLSHWDGAIPGGSAPLRGQGTLHEDLNHGQLYGSVRTHDLFETH